MPLFIRQIRELPEPERADAALELAQAALRVAGRLLVASIPPLEPMVITSLEFDMTPLVTISDPDAKGNRYIAIEGA